MIKNCVFAFRESKSVDLERFHPLEVSNSPIDGFIEGIFRVDLDSPYSMSLLEQLFVLADYENPGKAALNLYQSLRSNP